MNRIALMAGAAVLVMLGPAALAADVYETRQQNYYGGTGDVVTNCDYPSTTCFNLGADRDLNELTITVDENWGGQRVAASYELTAKEVCPGGCGYGGGEEVELASGFFCESTTIAPPTDGYYFHRKHLRVSVLTGLSPLFCDALAGDDAGVGLQGRVRVAYWYWENTGGWAS